MIDRFGIRWSCHPLLVLVLLTSAVTGFFTELIVLFATVLVHELGHVLAARGYGWRIREVKLLPFGGVMETEEAGSRPALEEAVVAAAGPLQNLWMGAASWLLGYAGIWDAAWADYLVEVNIAIGLFNLLPVLPLDGGRLLQALAGCGLSYYRTLAACAALSLWMSAGIILYSFHPLASPAGGAVNLNLLAVGIFLLLSNWTYRRNLPYVFIRFLMHRREASARRFRSGTLAQPIVVTGVKPVAGILRLLRRERYHLVYIMDEKGAALAVLPEQKIIDAYLGGGRPGRAVSELLR